MGLEKNENGVRVNDIWKGEENEEMTDIVEKPSAFYKNVKHFEFSESGSLFYNKKKYDGPALGSSVGFFLKNSLFSCDLFALSFCLSFNIHTT